MQATRRALGVDVDMRETHLPQRLNELEVAGRGGRRYLMIDLDVLPAATAPE